jgi:hypothetical protein
LSVALENEQSDAGKDEYDQEYYQYASERARLSRNNPAYNSEARHEPRQLQNPK